LTALLAGGMIVVLNRRQKEQVMSNGTDSYLAAFLTKAGGDGVVKRALKCFPDAEWIDIKDIELKKTGQWWAVYYDAIKDLLNPREILKTKGARQMIEVWLNDWAEHRDYLPVAEGLAGAFEKLERELPAASQLMGRVHWVGEPSPDDNSPEAKKARAERQGAVFEARNNLRDASFSLMMATCAGLRSGKEFGRVDDAEMRTAMAELRAADECERIFRRAGSVPRTLFLDPNESPAAYWRTKIGGLPLDAKAKAMAIADDLKNLEDHPDMKISERGEVFERLAENIEALGDFRSGRFAEDRSVEILSALLPEAMRGALKMERGARGAGKPLPSRPMTQKEEDMIFKEIRERRSERDPEERRKRLEEKRRGRGPGPGR
jgi:hypothetical protein